MFVTCYDGYIHVESEVIHPYVQRYQTSKPNRTSSSRQGLVRSEAVLSGAILVAAPFLLRSWARTEAGHHDTLECRNVLQTYIIAASGWTCAVLAAVAGNPVTAVALQVYMYIHLITCHVSYVTYISSFILHTY